MNRFRRIALCAMVNLRKWRTDGRIFLILLCVLAFSLWNLGGIRDFASDNSLPVTAWVFPHFWGNPSMLLLFGCMVVLLFCDAPFVDAQMAQWIVRMGRMDWLIGQILYIATASLLFTLWTFLSTVLALLPSISFENAWGPVLYTIAMQTGVAVEYNIVLSLSEAWLDAMAPSQAVAISLFMMWLVCMFMGMLLLASNIAINRRAGFVTGGFFAFLAYFTAYLGFVLFGAKVLWVSPVSWVSLYSLNWLGDAQTPNPYGAIAILLVAIMGFGALSAIVFNGRDLDIRQEGVLS